MFYCADNSDEEVVGVMAQSSINQNKIMCRTISGMSLAAEGARRENK